jgi:outer membrane protein assembly factor BamB
MKRVVIALAAASLLGGCGVFKSSKPKTPTIGERIPVLSAESRIEVDPALADVAITLPPVEANADWAQPGGNASKSMGHLALGSSLGRAWTADIGQGSQSRARTGARIWEHEVGDPKDRRGGISVWTGESTGAHGILFGGGVSFDNGRLYATSGLGDVEAIDAMTGAEVWRVRPAGPLRGAPTIANDNVYVITQDNQLFALNPADGKVRWNAAGTFETSGVFGAAAPAAAQGTVVAGFSSGELTAYRYENGRTVWQDALTRTSISTAVATISDIDAEPVIDQGRVYALGQGGRMVALELNTGQRIWEINVAGISTPWVAGEWVFAVTDQGQLMALARATGRVKWLTQLPRYRDEEDKDGAISWVGPVLAGDRLIVANSRGQIVNVSPLDGKVQSTVETKMSITLPLAVAGSTLYVLHDGGRLTAWR